MAYLNVFINNSNKNPINVNVGHYISDICRIQRCRAYLCQIRSMMMC
nr:MAG TPA: hypothetical protein [Caudoviricetes sp.]